MEQISGGASNSAGFLEPTHKEPTETKEDGHHPLVETLECDLGKNSVNMLSSSIEAIVSSTDCTQNFDVEDLTQSGGDSSDKVKDTILNDCCENLPENVVEHVEVDVENTLEKVQTISLSSPECGDTLSKGSEVPVQIGLENTSGEVFSTSTQCRKTLSEGCGDQDQTIVENTLRKVQSTGTEYDKSLIEDYKNLFQMDVESTSKTTSTDCGDNLSDGRGDLIQKIAENNIRKEQATTPKCIEKLLGGFKDEVQMAVENISGEVQNATTDGGEISSKGCETQIQMNVENSVSEEQTTSSGCIKKLLEGENQVQGNSSSENRQHRSENSCELVVDRVGRNSLDKTNILDGSLIEDTLMNFSVTGLSQLALGDSVGNGNVESIDQKDISPSNAPTSETDVSYAEVQSSDDRADVPNSSLENDDNLSSMHVSSEMEVDMSLVSDNLLSEVLEQHDIDSIFLSALSSQESDADNEESDSDRLLMDCDNSPKKVSADFPREKATSSVERLNGNEQNSTPGISGAGPQVTNSEELASNLVDNSESSVILRECGTATEGLPVVFKKINLPPALGEKASHLPERVQSSELKIGVKTDIGSSFVEEADKLDKCGNDEVKMETGKESKGISHKIVVQNGVLFVPSRMVVNKKEVPVKAENKLNPLPHFDVDSTWQVVKKKAMGMKQKREE